MVEWEGFVEVGFESGLEWKGVRVMNSDIIKVNVEPGWLR